MSSSATAFGKRRARRADCARGRFAPGLWIAALAAAVAVPAAAESGWEPALSVGFDVQNRGFKADVDSSLGIAGHESSTVLSSLFRFDAALYSPALFEAGGPARLVAYAGGQVPLSESSVIQQDNDNRSVPNADLGSRTEVIFDLDWYAGLGVEFALPIAQRQFKLRSSFDYFGQSLQFDGQVTRVEKDPSGIPLQTLSVYTSESELVHALGPRLTFDIEAARLGAFSLNVFLESQFYWILSEREIRFSGQSSDGTADFRVKLRPLIAQGGAGLRVVWRGD